MMRTERLTDAAHPLYEEALALYRASFPAHEQREAASQAAILRDPAYHFELLWEDDCFAGLLLYWDGPDMAYVEHFCIQPALRGQGCGARALTLLAARVPRIVLEIDPPVDAISVRRQGFYTRCGFCSNPYPHVHPPYHAHTAGHKLVVLSAPAALPQADYQRFARFLTDHVMRDAYA